MLNISHRGNINGAKSDYENQPQYIDDALGAGFEVEVDVWLDNDVLFLGHDFPQYKVDLDWLKNRKLWCHAKNCQALVYMLKNDIHCFWHQKDDCVLTSKNFIWCYPNIHIQNGISVIQDIDSFIQKSEQIKNILYGICSDYPQKMKNYI